MESYLQHTGIRADIGRDAYIIEFDRVSSMTLASRVTMALFSRLSSPYEQGCISEET